METFKLNISYMKVLKRQEKTQGKKKNFQIIFCNNSYVH